MTDNQKALAALSQALKLEQEGRAFYLKAAEETTSDAGQAMFESLAGDEKMHAEIILKQLHALEGGGSYVLLPNLTVRPIDLDAPLFPPDPKAMAKQVGPEPGEMQALFVALDNEIRSYDLYRNAAKETHDSPGKQMYQWLANAEMTHFNLLMNNYEALVALGAWV